MGRTCPACGAPTLSTPVRSRRTGAYTSTCIDFARCGHTVHNTTPSEPPSVPERHGRMFLPASTTVEPPPAPRPGAMARFDRAAVAGRTRHAIRQAQRQAAAAAATDPRQRQLGRES